MSKSHAFCEWSKGPAGRFRRQTMAAGDFQQSDHLFSERTEVDTRATAGSELVIRGHEVGDAGNAGADGGAAAGQMEVVAGGADELRVGADHLGPQGGAGAA